MENPGATPLFNGLAEGKISLEARGRRTEAQSATTLKPTFPPQYLDL